MSKLAWIVLQLAVIAWWVWVELDGAAMRGQEPHVALSVGVGVFFAFMVTAALVVARDAFRRLRSRMQSPTVPIGVDVDAGRLRSIAHFDQSADQDGGLIASGRRVGDPPKLLR